MGWPHWMMVRTPGIKPTPNRSAKPHTLRITVYIVLIFGVSCQLSACALAGADMDSGVQKAQHYVLAPKAWPFSDLECSQSPFLLLATYWQERCHYYFCYPTSLVVQMVKNPPAMWETQVQSLGWEDPLEKECNPLQYSCLENSVDRGAWQGVQFIGLLRVRLDWATNTFTFFCYLTISDWSVSMFTFVNCQIQVLVSAKISQSVMC